jgi:hypothetical protein
MKRLEAALDKAVFKAPEGSEALEAERKLMAIRTSLARAQAMAKDAERRLAPVSVLVSKKDNKVYIRQALQLTSAIAMRAWAGTFTSRLLTPMTRLAGRWSRTPRTLMRLVPGVAGNSMKT